MTNDHRPTFPETITQSIFSFAITSHRIRNFALLKLRAPCNLSHLNPSSYLHHTPPTSRLVVYDVETVCVCDDCSVVIGDCIYRTFLCCVTGNLLCDEWRWTDDYVRVIWFDGTSVGCGYGKSAPHAEGTYRLCKRPPCTFYLNLEMQMFLWSQRQI